MINDICSLLNKLGQLVSNEAALSNLAIRPMMWPDQLIDDEVQFPSNEMKETYMKMLQRISQLKQELRKLETQKQPLLKNSLQEELARMIKTVDAMLPKARFQSGNIFAVTNMSCIVFTNLNQLKSILPLNCT